MKKVLMITLAALIIAACGSEHKRASGHADIGVENAVKFAKEMVLGKMDGATLVEVSATDSVLLVEMMDEAAFKAIVDGVVSGTVPEQTLLNAVDSLAEVHRDIYATWKGWSGTIRKDDVRGKYTGQWRLLYTVTATLESGAKKEVRVLMEADRETPAMTEDEYKELRKKSTSLVDAMTGTFNWNY